MIASEHAIVHSSSSALVERLISGSIACTTTRHGSQMSQKIYIYKPLSHLLSEPEANFREHPETVAPAPPAEA